MLKLPVYLDYNSTTPCDARVLEMMLPYFNQSFGNAASRTHSFGWEAKEAVELAREQVASIIAAEKGEIIFTSGATESANLAIKGVFETYSSKGNHIITCNIEHKAVLDTCKYLEKKGADITYLPVDRDGSIHSDALEASIKPDTILIAIMYANNEIGTIMPIQEIGAIAKKHGVLFFTDATQAVGKIEVDVQKDEIDLLAFSSHKIYGPKGAGALYVRRKAPRVKLAAQIHGGGHEKEIRSGTLNVPAIVGFGKACSICTTEIKKDAEHTGKLRNKLEKALLSISDTSVNGSRTYRLPGTTNISFKGVNDESLISAINKDVAVSSGSACSSASMEPSYVLKALGLSDETAYNSIRFSVGRFTTEDEIDFTIQKLTGAVHNLRTMSPVV